MTKRGSSVFAMGSSEGSAHESCVIGVFNAIVKAYGQQTNEGPMEKNDTQKEEAYLDPDEFERFIKSLHVKCEQWLVGEETGDRLLAKFNRVKGKHWAIRGLSGKPDDFDWSTVPDELMVRAEGIDHQFQKAALMMAVAERAVKAVQTTGCDSIMNRAYNFGICSKECHFTPDS